MQFIVGHMEYSLCLGLYSATVMFKLKLCEFEVSVATAVAYWMTFCILFLNYV